jgi:hypothetical protein
MYTETDLCLGISTFQELVKIAIKYALHNGTLVKIFDFWFNLTERINVSLFVRLFNRDHKADVANITQLFNGAGRITGILSAQKAYLSCLREY